MPKFDRHRLIFDLYLLVPIAAAVLFSGHFLGVVYAIVAFGELVPLLFNNYAFMYLTVTGVAVQAPEPNPYLWMAVAAVGGALLIAGVIGIGKLMAPPAATK